MSRRGLSRWNGEARTGLAGALRRRHELVGAHPGECGRRAGEAGGAGREDVPLVNACIDDADRQDAAFRDAGGSARPGARCRCGPKAARDDRRRPQGVRRSGYRSGETGCQGAWRVGGRRWSCSEFGAGTRMVHAWAGVDVSDRSGDAGIAAAAGTGGTLSGSQGLKLGPVDRGAARAGPGRPERAEFGALRRTGLSVRRRIRRLAALPTQLSWARSLKHGHRTKMKMYAESVRQGRAFRFFTLSAELGFGPGTSMQLAINIRKADLGPVVGTGNGPVSLHGQHLLKIRLPSYFWQFPAQQFLEFVSGEPMGPDRCADIPSRRSINHGLPGGADTVGVTAADNRVFVEAVLSRYRAAAGAFRNASETGTHGRSR